ncbi:camphor resistance protein CrcB [Phenylobacterium sp. Root77]|jgi:CrcB protein|uniref:fluoride efflux transporter CrcB n=1 Tax=unclassified Phenylobacterium TaxID=2640670 RepID=UPI0006FC71CA|nr:MULTISPECIES: fluoride efflux transporter CrcB [unclassified Phenylobacterium]KQW71324.1 camphor resistance protein CrcB [Phenylobacterium sp. Root1277]KQW88344.1 camphor resistance protein CrcB [Phenylobacterium sp. Root1290]KRC38016.1 camphor resistance protein CrcB [Phenylobacterium sp. Root77]
MEKLLLVAAGGAAGAVARYAVGVQALRFWGPGWPFGTFIANVSGGLLMGMLAGYLAHRGGADQEKLRVFLGVGVLGGFTTFSAFSLETALMVERRTYGQAFAYASASVLLSISALFLGLLLARRIFA